MKSWGVGDEGLHHTPVACTTDKLHARFLLPCKSVNVRLKARKKSGRCGAGINLKILTYIAQIFGQGGCEVRKTIPL